MKKYLFAFLIGSVLASCKSNTGNNTGSAGQSVLGHFPQSGARSAPALVESFDTGTKTSYAAGNVSFPSGSWSLDGALTGSLAGDHKHGNAALRLSDSARVTMMFDVPDGATSVSVSHASYGTDPQSTWELWYSINGGSSWTKAGNTITTSAAILNPVSFALGVKGKVRFQLRKFGGGRLNIDDFTIINTTNATGAAVAGTGEPGEVGGPATRDDNMGMGNPSNATADESNADNFLMVKPQYTLSYNNSKGMANWVSWHLSTAWKGSAQRCNCFRPDPSLPASFNHVLTSNYIGVGFDRGHLCPSDDRDGSDEDNAATFLMSNMSPQAPFLNEQTWEALEAYSRTLINSGNELYIIAGGYGQGGTGGKGGVTNTLAGGRINVPSHFWKIVVVLPAGTGDPSRVSNDTRIIAVDMPNQQTVNAQPWTAYRTSVDAIEAATGYDFLTNVPVEVQKVVEGRVDNIAL